MAGVEWTHVKVLDGHGLATSEAGHRLVHAMRAIFSLYLAIAFIVWTVDQGVVAVNVDVVEQMASLDLFVTSLGLIWALDNEIIQDVEQKLGS